MLRLRTSTGHRCLRCAHNDNLNIERHLLRGGRHRNEDMGLRYPPGTVAGREGPRASRHPLDVYMEVGI